MIVKLLQDQFAHFIILAKRTLIQATMTWQLQIYNSNTIVARIGSRSSLLIVILFNFISPRLTNCDSNLNRKV